MRLLVDKKIPFFKEYLKKINNYDQFIIKYFDDHNLENDDCLNADALFVRSTTKINSKLLSNSPIKFIGSATSGYDHFDNDILNNSKYSIYIASGCNASAVVNWLLSCIGLLVFKKVISSNRILGIIGYGKVGKLLSKILKNLNIKHKVYDPYLGIGNINDIKDCEVISIHASYSETGKFPSHRLINSDFLGGASTKVIINSARGEIVDEKCILDSDIVYLSDVFQGEPSPNKKVISKCFLATPHIAGYSIEAKHNGTLMILKNFCKTKNLNNDLMGLSRAMEIKNIQSLEDDYTSTGYPARFFKNLIDVEQISIDFKESFLKKDIPFNTSRNNYALRSDFLGIKRTPETNKLSLFSNLYKNI